MCVKVHSGTQAKFQQEFRSLQVTTTHYHYVNILNKRKSLKKHYTTYQKNGKTIYNVGLNVTEPYYWNVFLNAQTNQV